MLLLQMKQLGVPVVVVALLLCLSSHVRRCDGSANVHVSDSSIVDEAGRFRIYHGANFVNKGFPWYPAELLDPVNLANLTEWGINFIRLG
jgi:endoglycosylceramidase